MRNKGLSKIFLSLAVVFMFTILLSAVTACDYHEEKSPVYDTVNDYLVYDHEVDTADDYTILESSGRSGCNDVNCVSCQYERLRQLLFDEVTETFNSNGEPVNIPRVSKADPPVSRDYFHVELTYEPTQECIDFILSYTGIPQNRINIVQAYYARSGWLWGYDFDFSESIECVEELII